MKHLGILELEIHSNICVGNEFEKGKKMIGKNSKKVLILLKLKNKLITKQKNISFNILRNV